MEDPARRYAAAQSVTEVGLGSLLHGLHVPLTGHFLSLNQGVLLTWAIRSAASRKEAVRRSSFISTLSALVKSFSPAGKRLFPMIAIATQGGLYSVGVALLGVNAGGAALGLALLSLWPFAQPLLMAYLIFGSPWFEAWNVLWGKVANALAIDPNRGPQVLVAVIVVYTLLAAGVALLAWRAGWAFQNRYLAKLTARAQGLTARPSSDARRPIPGAFRDLLHPWFLASAVLGCLAFWWAGQASEPVLAF